MPQDPEPTTDDLPPREPRREDLRAEAPWRGFAVSAAAHALVFAAVLYLLPGPPARRAPPPESITVELIDVPLEEEPPEAEPAALPPAAPKPPPPPPLPELAHARTILSGEALDARARAELRTLALGARFEQLCDVEAMEQIAKSDPRLKPERAIAYLTADTKVDGDTLTASGAAFLSEGRWYRLAFKCRTTPDRQKVVSFDFATGDELPEDDPRLPAGHSD